jgi:hypothetical protein
MYTTYCYCYVLLCVPLTVIVPLAAREPAHHNGCGPLLYKVWTPIA